MASLKSNRFKHAMTFKTILIPTDGSDLSDKATAAAIEFAQASGARIVGMSVTLPYLSSPLEFNRSAEDEASFRKAALRRAKAYLKRIAEQARAASVECETHVVESDDPSAGIVAAARRYHCDAIFMGSSWRKGLARILCGSATRRVLAQSDKPVIVIR